MPIKVSKDVLDLGRELLKQKKFGIIPDELRDLYWDLLIKIRNGEFYAQVGDTSRSVLKIVWINVERVEEYVENEKYKGVIWLNIEFNIWRERISTRYLTWRPERIYTRLVSEMESAKRNKSIMLYLL